VLDLWIENKYRLVNDAIAHDLLASVEKGRIRARCAAAPALLSTRLNDLETAVARAKSDEDSLALYASFNEHIRILERIKEAANLCDVSNAQINERSTAIGQTIQAALHSEHFRQWFGKRCEAFMVAYPNEIDCRSGITPALLFTVGAHR
jgi:hypothetical protein